MCVNNKWVKNPYTGKEIFVPCGKCNACRQEKAEHLAQKIRNQSKAGYVALFAHLTYDNLCLPYIKKSDLRTDLIQKKQEINIYRDSFNRRVRVSSDYAISKIRVLHEETIIGKVMVSPITEQEIPYLPEPTNIDDFNKVGVLFFDDFRNFVKRLRSYAKYHKPDFVGSFTNSFFVCAEYGENYSRPHFHLLWFIPKEEVEFWRSAIAANWFFDSYNLTYKSIEVAKNAASYVASYINSDADLHNWLANNFKVQRSHSLFFGRNKDSFAFNEIQKAIDRRDLRYDCLTRVSPRTYEVTPVPFPKYITDYWYPKFKGFHQLSDNEIYEILESPRNLQKYIHKLRYSTHSYNRFDKDGNSFLQHSDVFLFYRSLSCRLHRYSRVTGLDLDDPLLFSSYANDYIRFQHAKRSTMWRKFYENMKDDISVLESFDNLDSGLSYDPDLNIIYNKYPRFCADPNKFYFRVLRTQQLEETYVSRKKQHNLYGKSVRKSKLSSPT